MSRYSTLKSELEGNPKIWAISGVAGFIGSNILETLLNLNQKVIGLDNFSTGAKSNLHDVKALLEPKNWSNFKFIEGIYETFQCMIYVLALIIFCIRQH